MQLSKRFRSYAIHFVNADVNLIPYVLWIVACFYVSELKHINASHSVINPFLEFFTVWLVCSTVFLITCVSHSVWTFWWDGTVYFVFIVWIVSYVPLRISSIFSHIPSVAVTFAKLNSKIIIVIFILNILLRLLVEIKMHLFLFIARKILALER